MAQANIALLLILSLSLSSFAAVSIPPTTSPIPSPSHSLSSLSPGLPLIKQTCELATAHYDLCLEALAAVSLSHKANMQQLAAISLRLAQQNATENAGYIEGLRDRADDKPALQECLTDCTEEYEDAIEQLDDSTVALDANGYNDTITWIGAAMEDVKACQDGCKEVTEHRNVLTKRNGDFNKLCSITISIIRGLM